MSDDLLKRVQILLEANTAKFESGMARAEKISTQSSKEMSKGLSSFKAEMKQTQTKVDEFSRTLSKQQAQVSAMARTYEMLQASIKTAFAGVSISEITARSDSYTELNNKLKLVVQSQSDVTKATQSTFDIAQKTGSAWGSAADVYSKFAANAEALAVSQNDIARLTETVAKATAMSGSSAAGAADALTQFGQALASGKLQAEEFNSMQDNAAGVLDAMAKGLGITRGQLRQMMLQGELTGSIIVESLLKAGKVVDEQYKKTDGTVSQSWTRLNDQITKYVGEAATASNSSKALAGAITGVAENFDKVVNGMIIGAAFYVGTYIPAVYGSVTAGYAKVKQLIEESAVQATAIKMEQAASAQAVLTAQITLANTQSTLALLQAEKALEVQRLKLQISDQGRAASITRMAELKSYEAVVTNNLRVQEDALTAARQRANAAQSLSLGVGRGLLGVLGGPVGLGLTVAGIAASYLLFSDNADTATASMDNQKKTVVELRNEFDKLTDSQKRSIIRDAQDKTNVAKDEYDEQYESLLRLRNAIGSTLFLRGEDVDKTQELFRQYERGRISAQALATGMNQLNSVSEQTKKKIDNQTNAVKASNDKYEENKKILDLYLGTAPKVSTANAKETSDWNQKSAAIASATQALAAYKLEAAKDMQKMHKEAEYRAQGLSETAIAGRIKVDELFNYKGSDTPAYREAIQIADQTTYAKEQQEKIEKKLTEQKDLQLKSQEKANAQALLGNKQAQNMLRVYESLTKAGFSDAQARYFTAEVGREGNYEDSKLFGSHKDRNNGYTNTGMLSWQKDRSKSLMTYLGTQGQLDDNGQILKTQDALDAQAKFLFNEVFNNKAYAKSRNALTNNASSFESLQQTVGQNYVGWDINGSKLSSKAVQSNKNRMNSYYSQVNGLLGSNPDQLLSNANEILSVQDSMVQAQIKLKVDQLEIQKSLYTDWQKLETDNTDRIKEIRDKFVSDPKERDKLLGLQQKAYSKDVENWFQSQVERESAEHKANDEIVKSRLEAWQKLQDAQNYIDGVQYDSANYLYRRDQPAMAEITDLQNQHLDDQNGLAKNYSQQRSGIFNTENDEGTRSQLLLAAHEQYLQAKAQLDEKYAQQEKDLRVSQLDMNLQYGEQIFGSMTQMLKDSGDEQSGIYKAMFATEKAFAIASAAVQIPDAMSKALNLPFPANLGAMGTVATLGAEIVSNISSVAGVFHGGVDYVPKETSYLLDEGERVLSPRQNKDLTGFLASRDSSSVQTNSANVNINHDPSLVVETNDDGMGNIDVYIRKVAGGMIRQSWSNLNNPNSRESKSMRQNYISGRKRS